MGDIGALSLGAALGTIAVVDRQEIVLAIMGGLFVIETVSVMLQVASFRLIGRRIFRMAPLHHHFEQKGWREPQVTVRFWIISLILVLIGLATLKVRLSINGQRVGNYPAPSAMASGISLWTGRIRFFGSEVSRRTRSRGRGSG